MRVLCLPPLYLCTPVPMRVIKCASHLCTPVQGLSGLPNGTGPCNHPSHSCQVTHCVTHCHCHCHPLSPTVTHCHQLSLPLSPQSLPPGQPMCSRLLQKAPLWLKELLPPPFLFRSSQRFQNPFPQVFPPTVTFSRL